MRRAENARFPPIFKPKCSFERRGLDLTFSAVAHLPVGSSRIPQGLLFIIVPKSGGIRAGREVE
jgi:hypothetical protein